MALLGTAAIILSFDVELGAVGEHDDWHTHEHFPERMSIPGFLRGTRWVALAGSPRYFVLYEVEDVAVTTCAAYLARLNAPTPWTAKMMPHYRRMTRGLCAVTGTFGVGTGQAALLIRFNPAANRMEHFREWLRTELPRLPSQPGLGSAHLFEEAATPPTTTEQRIRGADSKVDWAVFVTGYDEQRVADLCAKVLSEARFRHEGAQQYEAGLYRFGYSLARVELAVSRDGQVNRAVADRRAQSQ